MPTESTILGNYLLVPAQLPTVISLDEFRSLFPPQYRSSPQVRSLYRDLQRQRSDVVEEVSKNIEEEAGRNSKRIRRIVSRADRIDSMVDEIDAEDEVEKMLFDPSSGKCYTSSNQIELGLVVQSMETSVSAIESQIKDLQAEEARLLESVTKTVGDLSDLRYGRLANAKLPEQVLDGLQNLQDICQARKA